MRVNDKPLEAWVIVSSGGTVQSSHCTCMAGLGEGCSHIAAVLFALEHGSRVSKEASVTDVPAYWLFPTAAKFSTPFQRICDMDFRSASKKRKLTTGWYRDPSFSRNYTATQPEVTGTHTPDACAAFFDALHKASMPNAAVLSLTAKYSENFIPKTITGQLPKALGTLYDATLQLASYEDVLSYCASLDVSVSAEQVRFVLSQTKQQAMNPLWFKMRAGRVTASNFHAACHTSMQKPSISLLKRICTPTHTKFISQATDWGTQHEEVGRKQYMAQAVSQHFIYYHIAIIVLYRHT